MNVRLRHLLVLPILLSACGQGTSSVSEEDLREAGKNSGRHTMTDTTGRVHWTVPDSFASGAIPEGHPSLTLSAQNSDASVLLTVDYFGDLKTTPQQYFAQLTEEIKSASGAQIGVATENRMNYRLSHEENGARIDESCLATVVDHRLYTVCAAGIDVSPDLLNEHLKDVRIDK